MLGKVLRYDIKFGKTAFLSMAGALILIGMLTRVFNTPFVQEWGVNLIMPLSLVGVIVAYVLLVFQNFNKNLFGAEGYLTLTLPVKRRKLMVSKLLTTLLWFNVMMLAIFIMLAFMFPETITELKNTGLYDGITYIFQFVMLNLAMINVTLFLYMMSATAHLSIAGKRPGWPLGVVVLVAATVLESLFGSKLLVRLTGDWVLWLVQVGGKMTFHFIRDPFSLYQSVDSAMPINFTVVITLVLFSALSWLATLYCIKKRVDLP